jgi:hypothetical protein
MPIVEEEDIEDEEEGKDANVPKNVDNYTDVSKNEGNLNVANCMQYRGSELVYEGEAAWGANNPKVIAARAAGNDVAFFGRGMYVIGNPTTFLAKCNNAIGKYKDSKKKHYCTNAIEWKHEQGQQNFGRAVFLRDTHSK